MYTILLAQFFGVLAQLVERMAGSHEVTGSNPVHSTIEFFQVLYGTCFFIVRDRDDLYGVRADEVEMRPRGVSRGVKRASDAFLTFRPTELAREGSAFSRIDIRWPSAAPINSVVLALVVIPWAECAFMKRSVPWLIR